MQASGIFLTPPTQPCYATFERLKLRSILTHYLGHRGGWAHPHVLIAS